MSPNSTSLPDDDPALRELLRRCSSATYYAACKFRQSARRDDLRTVVVGVVERFVARDLRFKLQAPADSVRLSEDLGLDSLTMMEIVLVAEEVLGFSVANDELPHLRTVGEVISFIEANLADRIAEVELRSMADSSVWDFGAVSGPTPDASRRLNPG